MKKLERLFEKQYPCDTWFENPSGVTLTCLPDSKSKFLRFRCRTCDNCKKALTLKGVRKLKIGLKYSDLPRSHAVFTLDSSRFDPSNPTSLTHVWESFKYGKFFLRNLRATKRYFRFIYLEEDMSKLVLHVIWQSSEMPEVSLREIDESREDWLNRQTPLGKKFARSATRKGFDYVSVRRIEDDKELIDIASSSLTKANERRIRNLAGGSVRTYQSSIGWRTYFEKHTYPVWVKDNRKDTNAFQIETNCSCEESAHSEYIGAYMHSIECEIYLRMLDSDFIEYRELEKKRRKLYKEKESFLRQFVRTHPFDKKLTPGAMMEIDYFRTRIRNTNREIRAFFKKWKIPNRGVMKKLLMWYDSDKSKRELAEFLREWLKHYDVPRYENEIPIERYIQLWTIGAEISNVET